MGVVTGIFLFISENYTENFYLLFYEHFFLISEKEGGSEGVRIRKVEELQG